MKIVICSVPLEKSKDIAFHILEKRLAACVQILPVMDSLYWWEGKICQSQENLLLFKTSEAKAQLLLLELKNTHPYTVPEIIALDIAKSASNQDYIRWIQQITEDEF